MDAVIDVRDLARVYRMGRIEVPALSSVSFAIQSGEMVAIMGPSGSGKSTLLNLLGLLDRPTAGTYRLAGDEVSRLSDERLAQTRNRRVGFVFQSYNLVAQMTALENVVLPLQYRGVPARRRREMAVAALDAVGVLDRQSHRPAEMSGGQQQRVGIARALAGEPDVLLADEPTGNLDSATGQAVLDLFRELNARGRTVVIVTHDQEVATACQRVIALRDGRVLSDGKSLEGGGA